tara:strand:+ start:2879 stop:3229 length:351 start_codon:yes stop_codon:yes gene_type:complete
MYGIVEYDNDGKPKCEICGEHFDRVISHVRQKHDISALEYKKRFGFDTKKGICSERSKNLSRLKVFENYNKVVKENLLKKGSTTRFKKGCKGRTREQLSEQSKIRLSNQLKPSNND